MARKYRLRMEASTKIWSLVFFRDKNKIKIRLDLLLQFFYMNLYKGSILQWKMRIFINVRGGGDHWEETGGGV
eukprot:14954113-Ditylum_brightwellii.AAC.1